jgi:hypothetical protein
MQAALHACLVRHGWLLHIKPLTVSAVVPQHHQEQPASILSPSSRSTRRNPQPLDNKIGCMQPGLKPRLKARPSLVDLLVRAQPDQDNPLSPSFTATSSPPQEQQAHWRTLGPGSGGLQSPPALALPSPLARAAPGLVDVDVLLPPVQARASAQPLPSSPPQSPRHHDPTALALAPPIAQQPSALLSPSTPTLVLPDEDDFLSAEDTEAPSPPPHAHSPAMAPVSFSRQPPPAFASASQSPTSHTLCRDGLHVSTWMLALP